jgi:hypothetical protein
MAERRKRKNGGRLPPPTAQNAFLILEDTAGNVYVVGAGALGKPVRLTSILSDALDKFKKEAGNKPVLNVTFAALIDQGDALQRLAGNAHRAEFRD